MVYLSALTHLSHYTTQPATADCVEILLNDVVCCVKCTSCRRRKRPEAMLLGQVMRSCVPLYQVNLARPNIPVVSPPQVTTIVISVYGGRGRFCRPAASHRE